MMSTPAEEIREGPYKVIEKDEWFRVSGPTSVATGWFDRGGAQDAADELNAAYARGQKDRRIPRPIDEAPKDGTHILAYFPTMKRWRVVWWHSPTEGTSEHWCDHQWIPVHDPTEWLPSPPNAEQR
jgi:hypothetical protein